MVEEQLLSRAEATDKARQGAILALQWRTMGEGQQKREQRSLVRSADFFETQQVVLDDVTEFVVVGGRAFANRRSALWISQLAHFSFVEARLPAALTKGSVLGMLMSEHHYLMGVPTEAGKSVLPGPVGRLFRSDASGETWTLAVDKCHHISSNKTGATVWQPDIHMIQGVEGAVLANKVVQFSEDNPQDIVIRTYGTHDNGIHWSSVSDSKCDAGEVCKLHLGLVGWNSPDVEDSWTSATSMVTAPGVVMAMGARTKHRAAKALEWGLYHTRDAGAIWSLVADGPQHWAMGDHGAVALTVKAKKLTASATFSWTEGWHHSEDSEWEQRTFDQKMMTDRVVLGHSAYVPQTSYASAVTPQTHMLILGHKTSTGEGLIVPLDVTSGNSSFVQCDSSVMEKWSVGGQGCILGRRTMCARRAVGSQCFIGGVMGLKCEKSHCVCSSQDYECDYGFTTEQPEKSITASKSVDLFGAKKCHLDPEYYKSPSDKRFAAELYRLYHGKASLKEVCSRLGSMTLNIPSGYRKIPGDSCVHDDDIPYKKCLKSGMAPADCGEAAYKACVATSSVGKCISLHGAHGSVKMQCEEQSTAKDNTARKISSASQMVTTKFSGMVERVFWVGHGHNRVAFALINQNGGTLYRSTDHGASWEKAKLECQKDRDYSTIQAEPAEKPAKAVVGDGMVSGDKKPQWSIGGHHHDMEPPKRRLLAVKEDPAVAAAIAATHEAEKHADEAETHAQAVIPVADLIRAKNGEEKRIKKIVSDAEKGPSPTPTVNELAKLKADAAKATNGADHMDTKANTLELHDLQHDINSANSQTDKIDHQRAHLENKLAEDNALRKEKTTDVTAKLNYDAKVADAAASYNYKDATRKENALVSQETKELKILKTNEDDGKPPDSPAHERETAAQKYETEINQDGASATNVLKNLKSLVSKTENKVEHFVDTEGHELMNQLGMSRGGKEHSNGAVLAASAPSATATTKGGTTVVPKKKISMTLINHDVSHDVGKMVDHAVSDMKSESDLDDDILKTVSGRQDLDSTLKKSASGAEKGQEAMNKDVDKTVDDIVRLAFGPQKTRTEFFKAPPALKCGNHDTRIKEIVVSPADPHVAVIIGMGRIHWYTDNAGKTFTTIYTNWKIGGVRFHKDEPQHLLAVTEDERSSLILSRNLGKNWIVLGDYVRRPFYDWVPAPGSDRERVCAVVFKEKPKKKVGSWTKKTDLLCTLTKADKPRLQNFDPMGMKHGNRFDLVGHHILVAVATNYGDGSAALWVGNRLNLRNHDEGDGVFGMAGFVYEKMKLPLEALKYGYDLTRMQGQRHHVFIATGHGRDGMLYRLNLRAGTFTESLSGIARGGPSLVAVQGVEGHFFANRYVPLRSDNVIRTVLTVDNGGNWANIEPPRDDKNGYPYSCKPGADPKKGCSVVDGTKSVMKLVLGGVVTSHTSHGIVIANGHVVSEFPGDSPYIHAPETFMSRDGGLSWEAVLQDGCAHLKKGSEEESYCLQRFAFGDHGSILAAAPAKGEVRNMKYTLDEGITWHHVLLPRMSALAQVTQQLEAASTSFMVVGLAEQAKAREGVVIFIDFGGLKQRRCVGEEWASKPGSDYEKWAPRTSSGLTNPQARCFNGHQTFYVRRMRMNDCTVHIRRQLLEHRHLCRCTLDDYECRQESGDVCLPPKKALSQTVANICKKTGRTATTKVQGYRRTDSNTCTAGVVLPTKATRCAVLKPNGGLPGVKEVAARGPPGPPVLAKNIQISGTSTTVMVVVIVACVVGFLAGGLFLYLYLKQRASVEVQAYRKVAMDEESAMDQDMEDVVAD